MWLYQTKNFLCSKRKSTDWNAKPMEKITADHVSDKGAHTTQWQKVTQF